METLTTMEEIRLRNLEAIITKGEQTFVDVANALQEICEKRLYRKDCGTFEEYMRKKWHKSARWAQRLIKSSAAIQELPEEMRPVGRKLGVNENTARAFSNVPQELRVAVAEHINHSHKPITSTAIKEAEIVVRTKKEKVLDKVGTVIPNEILPLWERKVEFETLTKEMRQLKSRLKNLIHEDPLWRKVSEVASDYAGNIASAIDSAMPYAVCMKCGGWFKQTQNGICPPCDNTGFMSKNQYDVWNEDEKRLRKNDNLSRLPNGVPRQNL